MKKYSLALFIWLLSNNIYALGLNSGAEVLKACQIAEDFLAGKNSDARNSEACVHFLMGFDSGQSVANLSKNQDSLYCQPKGTNIKSMVSSVVIGLKQNKQYHEAPAGIAVWKALEATWPCKQ